MSWFNELDKEAKLALTTAVILLKKFGPQLKRPYADTLKGSQFKNLKELRAKTSSQVLRVAFIFDEQRKAFFLLGEIKKGKKKNCFIKN